ncbi:hypothetical protein LNQ03_08495 [Klebsiella pneumoniae subsp. pneumoniae]|nr:hypothetical protein [Klebsiella pneumoniae subsp. pneumoniae]
MLNASGPLPMPAQRLRAIRRDRSASPAPGMTPVYMGYPAPTGMIFIPCKDGISRSEGEYASPEHSRRRRMACCCG